MKICRSFVIVSGDYAVLLEVMRRALIIGKFLTRQLTQAGWVKMSHQPLLFVKANLNPKYLLCIFFK